MNTLTPQERETLIRAALAGPEPDAAPRVKQFTIGRTWSFPGKYGNAKLEFVIETPPGVDLAEVITAATEAIEDMNPTDDDHDAQAITEEIDRLRAPDAEKRAADDFSYYGDDFKGWRANRLAKLEEMLAEAGRLAERRRCGAEQIGSLISLAARTKPEVR